jgi:putative DNA methylase
MTQRKKLIEVALPLEAINVASAREKSIRHGHPSTLHLWWARRPLAAARAVIFSSLVDDPDSPDALPAFVEACKQLPKGKNAQVEDTPRQRLFDFIELLVQWESTTNEDVLKTARELILIATEGNPPPLLDPFAGGGSIPLEAQRLGLEAHASDLNPVAVMINKAQIEIPPRFANMPPVNPRDRAKMFGEGDKVQGKQTKNKQQADTTWKGAAGLAADVRYYGEWMREKAWETIGHLYPTYNGETVVAWIWARTVKSPNPAVNAYVPLVRSFTVCKKKGRERWAKPIIEGNTVHFEITEGLPPKDVEGTMNRRGGTCIISGEPIPFEYIREEAKAGRMSAMLMAIVTEGRGGRNYYSPTQEHANVADMPIPNDAPTTDLPEQALGFRIQNYGLTKHAHLFTPRQLTALLTFSDLVIEAREKIYNDTLSAGLQDDNVPLRSNGFGALAYAEAVSVYLAFAVDRCSDYWSTIATWHTNNQQIRATFARQAIPMTWDYVEPNPLSNSSGGWNSLYSSTWDALKSLPEVSKSGISIQADATQVQTSAIVVSTDPPYYDNIGYADLSDYLYVWMRKSLRNVYPDVFSTVLVPKEPELIASPHRHGGRDAANQHFESGLQRTFINIRRFISPNFPLSIYYAFKQQDSDIEDDDEASEADTQISSAGWETMLSSLVLSGFSIDGTWPIRSEQNHRMRAHSSNALASSIVLVCRPRAEDAPNISRRAFIDAMRRELPAALKEMQTGNIAPVDLSQATIGPGISIYSRYSKVLEADGTAMSVRTALGLINQMLFEYLEDDSIDIDVYTRFALAWFALFGFEDGDFGQADVMARGKNTSVAGVEAAGLVIAGRGKVRLKHWTEYDPGAWNPQEDKRATVWEATHHLIERLNHHGEKGSAMLMMQLPHDMAAEARSLAYRLYSICERKGWADHARDYNALVISWAEIGDVSAQLREAKASGDAVEQKRLFED